MSDYSCPEVFWKIDNEGTRMLATQSGYGKWGPCYWRLKPCIKI
jgi:hypothetical protein